MRTPLPRWRIGLYVLAALLVAYTLASSLLSIRFWALYLVIVYALVYALSPSLAVNGLYKMHCQGAALNYATWAAKCFPNVVQRAACASQAANIHAEREDFSRAIVFADRGITLMESRLDKNLARTIYAGCINVKGMGALYAGSYQESYEAFYRPLRMALQHPVYIPLLYANCSGALQSMGRFADAEEYARQALALVPKGQPLITFLGHHNLAGALLEQGRMEEALAASRRAQDAKLSARYEAMAKSLHSLLLELRGHSDEADALFADAEARLPQSGEATRNSYYGCRGRSFWHRGCDRQAEADFKEALSEKMVNPSALYHLALIAQKRNDQVQAQEWRERLLREVPESFYAGRVRQASAGGVV